MVAAASAWCTTASFPTVYRWLSTPCTAHWTAAPGSSYIPHQGTTTKALVYKYLENGSLDCVMFEHGSGGGMGRKAGEVPARGVLALDHALQHQAGQGAAHRRCQGLYWATPWARLVMFQPRPKQAPLSAYMSSNRKHGGID